ncbi:hypothetical protein GCM10011507_21460 [Edaphobacter acidisoli]|uniref:DUF4440 domain-containing protein n=1 Tax=Edaphobacter acidisoli TaxID=2040573 RepID=A0A916RUH7_9BACT|nr:DUF4440 domain-containing protein [Edaphobacter acidisoli]GGA69634.1 hypothetical protein GCM10011507_21460 [Edaphobacter acidisoli]
MQAAQIQDHLYTLEERLFHPDREANRADLIPLLADEFQEFCSSGRIMNRQQAIDAMLNSSARTATLSYFYVSLLAPNVALATYHATTLLHVSHRSSIWIERDGRWQMLFHQGTIAS